MNNSIDWSKGQEVIVEKQCECLGCINKFKIEWKDQRRCPRCRAEKREYKNNSEPF